MEIMKRLVREEEGQGLVEYALIIAIISIIVVTAGPAVAAAIQTKFAEIAAGLN